jgi:hypothetical protein
MRTSKPAKPIRKASKPARLVHDDYRPSIEPFAPTLEDREWSENALRGVFDDPPFWDQLSAIAHDFRARGDDLGRFVGQELDRPVTTAR